MGAGAPLRSRRWFGSDDVVGLLHRASLHGAGIPAGGLGQRPAVGVCNSWSEVVNCNLHFRTLAQAVKRGVSAQGGFPLEFPTISLGENLMKPTTMLFRNLMAMDVEESIRAYPFDSVVLLAGCDKTIPAQLMGAASVDLPAIMVTGGPSDPAEFQGRRLGVGTDLWHYTDAYRGGRMDHAEYARLEAALIPTPGHCNEMGTASTMSVLVEALGLALPGSAATPAQDASRYTHAEDAGKRAVEIALDGPRPSEILGAAAFDNAITVLMAVGGSTNAVVHLLALAGRVGVDLPLERFREIQRRTPVLLNLRPSGAHLMDDFHRAGGVPALLRELASLLRLDAITVTGRSLGDCLAASPAADTEVIARLDHPLRVDGAISVLRGSLAPAGAVIKISAASAQLVRHRGRAVVFRDIHDLASRIDSPDLAVDADSVLVLQNAGPVGGPGMPEWGQLPIPQKLLKRGITDLVRVSDARMSGTAYGTVILHVAPEAAVGGPLGVVKDGDPIVVDVEAGRLDLDIPADDLDGRLAAWTAPPAPFSRGYGRLYSEHVLQADQGCDFDILRKVPGEAASAEPGGILSGWIGGW